MSKPKILIVEDELQAMENIERYLNRILECDIDRCKNGYEAIEKMVTISFDLVILDLKMPGISGVDVIKETKGTPNFPDILVITAWDSDQVANEVIAEGAVDYIPKPIELETLKLKIKGILEEKGKYTEKKQ